MRRANTGRKGLTPRPGSVLHLYLPTPMCVCISSNLLTLTIEVEQHIDSVIASRVHAGMFRFSLSQNTPLYLFPSPPTLTPPLPSSLPLAPNRLDVRPFPPAAVDREPSPQVPDRLVPRAKSVRVSEVAQTPSSAVLQGTLDGLTPAGLLLLRRRRPPLLCPV